MRYVSTFDASLNSKYPSMYLASFVRSVVSMNYSKLVHGVNLFSARICSIRRDEIILSVAFLIRVYGCFLTSCFALVGTNRRLSRS